MPYRLTIRLLSAALGLAAVAWGAATLPTFWKQARIEKLAPHILGREPFSRDVLAALQSELIAAEGQAYCRPAAIRSGAIIRLRTAEEAMAEHDRAAIDGALRDTENSIRGSLACAPADPFLWLGLFWVANAREGFTPRNLAYLRLSYELGPNEGWIAFARNRMALAMFDSLPADLKAKAVAEFLAFIETGLPDIAADIFTTHGERVRNLLLARTADLDQASRAAFANSLRYKGYDEVKVPGVQPPPKQPWQH
jgi:hypothetical protein